MAIAFVNGVLHRGYEGVLGQVRAEQASNLVLLLLLVPWVARIERRHRLATVRDAVRVGVVWASATVVFEFLFGYYVNGDAWADLLGAYRLLDGRLWLLTVIGIAAAPLGAQAWRLRLRPDVDARQGSEPSWRTWLR